MTTDRVGSLFLVGSPHNTEIMVQDQVEIMVQDPADDIPACLKRALECFDRHQLNEAKTLLHRVLCSLEGRTLQGHEKMYVDALASLAELYFKRSRTCHHDDMAWHKVMLQSAALQNELVRYCEELAERRSDAGDERATEWCWLDESLKKSEQLMAVIRSFLVGSLLQRVATASKRRPTDQIAHAPVFVDTGWLERFDAYLRGETGDRPGRGPSPDHHKTKAEAPASPRSPLSSSSDDRIVEAEVKRVDCDRVQRTIMKLVRQISSDIRQRFIRRKLPEDVFRETVSSEMIAKCSPMPETKDVLALFENAIIQYNYGMSSDEFRELNADSFDLDSEEQGNETMSTDTQCDDQPPINLPYMPAMCQGEMPSEVEDDLEEGDDSYSFPGVLTIWRAYGKHDNAHIHPSRPSSRPYLLEGFEELSALTETDLSSSDQYVPETPLSAIKAGDASVHKSPATNDNNEEQRMYVTKGRIQHALAMMLVECARTLQKDPHGLNQACELYKYALGILQVNDTEQNGRQELIAHIFKNVGIIRCTQGDISIGSQLMRESMELFSADDNVENINVAEVWYLLGDAFMQQQWKEDTIFEHVMKLVRDELNSEVRTDVDVEGKDVADDVSIDSESSDGGASYCICAHEALGCYRSALAILGRLRRRRETHTSLYVDVLTKLADCSIMVGEYERAVLCYEEALYLCQNTLGSVSLANSAHVLSMLGTTNFLLGTYSKAATMFETANILQQHLYGLEDNFEMAFTLSMLGNTYYVMNHYHKCISWCMKAFELYTNIYKQEIVFVDSLHRWFIIQTLYCLGYAYSTLNFHDKALHNLELAKNLIEKARDGDIDIQQHVNILKVMADVYANLEKNDLALEYYQSALDQSLLVGNERSTITLQNQLLNRMAGIHVNTRQYTTAAEYLEQALDCQRNVENSIRGDLMGIMYQLGITYTLAGDIERAMECFNEFCEAFQEAQGTPGLELASALSNLGNLYHLKGCMQDDNEDMIEYLESAEQYYRDALAVDSRSPVCVYYANFLHQQEQYADALNVMLRYVFFVVPDDFELRYNGPEQAVLPEHLLHDLDDMDEVILDARAFAKFLGILCLKQLSLYEDALDCLETMVAVTYRSEVALNHAMLGYALIELGLYVEAAWSFDIASSLQHENEVSVTNLWISLCLWVYSVLYRGCYHIWETVTEAYVDLVGPAPTPMQTQVANVLLHLGDEKLRDSGYYDHTDEVPTADQGHPSVIVEDVDIGYASTSHEVAEITSPDVTTTEDVFSEEVYEEWHTEEVEETPPHILEAILRSQRQAAENAANNNREVGDDGVQFVTQGGAGDDAADEWIIEEEVTLETPAAIIAALAGKLTRPDPVPGSKFSSPVADIDEDLRHKPASSSSLYITETSETSWSNKQRMIQPPNRIEGLHRNYEYSRDYGMTESRLNVFSFSSQHDTNSNGAYHASLSASQSRDIVSNAWSVRSDGLNANNSNVLASMAELNANVVNDEQEEEEVWEVIEETVETPPAILAAMLANESKQHT